MKDNDPMRLSRRTMLAMLGVSACGMPNLTEPGPESARFPLGIASGEATAAGILLWTRYVGSAQVRLLLWRDGEEAQAPLRALELTPGEGGVVHEAITGLEAGRWHVFLFVELTGGVETARSERGRFRTALAEDSLEPIRVGAVACTKQSFPLDTLLQASRRTDLDAFLLLGDTVYADGGKTVEGFSEKWKEGLSRYPQRRLRRSTSVIATWDDHEVQNDFDGTSEDSDVLTAGREAFFRHQPIHRLPEAPDRIWRSFRWGRTAEFFVLDCRSERNRATGEYLSEAQLDWLKAGLSQSTAVFKVILNSVPISEFSGAFFEAFAHDRWEAFPRQRAEILQHIDDAKIPGVLWVSGDFHLGCVGRVATSGPGATAIEALVGPGGQVANLSPSYPGPPQFDFSTAVNNFVVIDLVPQTSTARLRYISGSGALLSDTSYVL